MPRLRSTRYVRLARAFLRENLGDLPAARRDELLPPLVEALRKADPKCSIHPERRRFMRDLMRERRAAARTTRGSPEPT